MLTGRGPRRTTPYSAIDDPQELQNLNTPQVEESELFVEQPKANYSGMKFGEALKKAVIAGESVFEWGGKLYKAEYADKEYESRLRGKVKKERPLDNKIPTQTKNTVGDMENRAPKMLDYSGPPKGETPKASVPEGWNESIPGQIFNFLETLERGTQPFINTGRIAEDVGSGLNSVADAFKKGAFYQGKLVPESVRDFRRVPGF